MVSNMITNSQSLWILTVVVHNLKTLKFCVSFKQILVGSTALNLIWFWIDIDVNTVKKLCWQHCI